MDTKNFNIRPAHATYHLKCMAYCQQVGDKKTSRCVVLIQPACPRNALRCVMNSTGQSFGSWPSHTLGRCATIRYVSRIEDSRNIWYMKLCIGCHNRDLLSLQAPGNAKKRTAEPTGPTSNTESNDRYGLECKWKVCQPMIKCRWSVYCSCGTYMSKM
jgi:hypothetical protein